MIAIIVENVTEDLIRTENNDGARRGLSEIMRMITKQNENKIKLIWSGRLMFELEQLLRIPVIFRIPAFLNSLCSNYRCLCFR